MVSIKELKKIVNPYNEHRKAPLYSKYFMRHISVYITWLLLHTKITANQVTIFQIVPGIISALFFAVGKIEYSLFGLLFWQISYLFDFVDGEIARYRKNTTIKGVYLDLVAHKVIESVIWLGLGWGLYRYTGQILFIAMGFIVAFFAIDILSACFPQTVIALIKSKKFLADIKPALKEERTEKQQNISKINSFTRVYNHYQILFVSVTKMHLFTITFLIEFIFSFFMPLKMFPIMILFFIYTITSPIKEIISITKNLNQKRIENEIKEIKEHLEEKLSKE